MRALVAATALIVSAFCGAQTYTQLFDLTEPVLRFQKIAVDGVRNIYVAGEENGTVTARKINENGAIQWTTALAGTTGGNVQEITLDADGNIYIAALIGPANAKSFLAASFDRNTGAVRWTKQVANALDSFTTSVTTAKVGNSVLVYAAMTTIVSSSNNDVLAFRLSPTNGSEVWRRQINLGPGVTVDASQRITTNGGGAPIILARRSTSVSTSVIRLSGTDGSTVFKRDFPGLFAGPDSMQVLTGNNNIAVSGGNSDPERPTTVALLNGVNGNLIASENVAGFDVGGRSTKFGAYLAPRAGGGTFFMLRMDGTTGRFAQVTVPSPANRILAIDGQDQIHYSVLASQTGRMERSPAGLTQDVPFSPFAGVADNKNNLIVLALSSGVNHVVKFAQGMRINDDNFNEPFGSSLTVPAPGVLLNDAAFGATLAVVSGPFFGSVTLNQNGGFTYTPESASVTDDQFVYTASRDGITQTAIVVVRRNTFDSLTSFDSTVIGSQPITAFANFKFTPTLPGTISVTDNSPLLSEPPALSINTLSNKTSIPITTAIVSSAFSLTVTATAYGTARSLNVVIQPGGLGSLTLGGSGNMIAGETAVGRITLTAPAPSGGREIQLKKVQGNATIPLKVTVPAGSTFGIFTILSPQSTTGSTLEVQATLFEGVRTAFRIIEPMPKVASVEIPATIVGGQTVQAAISLDKKTPYNLNVATAILDNSAGATAPSSLLVVKLSQSSTLNITVPATNVAKAFKLQASVGGATITKQVVVISNPLDRVTAIPSTLTGGNASVGTVHLNNLAPVEGLSVDLSTNRPGLVAIPARVQVAGGSWAADFQIQTKPVSLATGATINARVAGVTKSVTLTLLP